MKPACEAQNLPRATFYRDRRDTPPCAPPAATRPDPEERTTGLKVLNAERFVDRAPGD